MWPGGVSLLLGGRSRADRLIGGGGVGAWPGGVSLIGRKEGDSGFISPEGAAIGGRSSGGRSEGRPVTEEEGKSVFDHID